MTTLNSPPPPSSQVSSRRDSRRQQDASVDEAIVRMGGFVTKLEQKDVVEEKNETLKSFFDYVYNVVRKADSDIQLDAQLQISQLCVKVTGKMNNKKKKENSPFELLQQPPKDTEDDLYEDDDVQ